MENISFELIHQARGEKPKGLFLLKNSNSKQIFYQIDTTLVKVYTINYKHLLPWGFPQKKLTYGN